MTLCTCKESRLFNTFYLLNINQILTVFSLCISTALVHWYALKYYDSSIQYTILVCLYSQMTLTSLLFLSLYIQHIYCKRTVLERWSSLSSQDNEITELISITDDIDESVIVKCSSCKIKVLEGTRHCNRCNICVEGFDHHCRLLCVCIGKRNYRVFIALLQSTIGLLSIQITVIIMAIVRDIHESQSKNTKLLTIGSLVLFPIGLWISLVLLYVFHIYLSVKGLKTYEWLTQTYGQ